MYQLPRSPTLSLPDLAGLVLEVRLQYFGLLVLGDFSVHAEAGVDKLAQDVLAAMGTMVLSQIVSLCTDIPRDTHS